MLRRILIIPIWTAMLMMLFVTIVPHHHHQAMICLVHEVCELDGCCDDEHTNHSDANHEEDESHCISHERYFPSDDLRVSFDFIEAPSSHIPCPEAAVVAEVRLWSSPKPVYLTPNILSWRLTC